VARWSDTRVQVVLAVVVTLAATFAAYCVDRAGDERREQVREVERRGAAIVETVRRVYAEEAPRLLLHAWLCAGEQGAVAVPEQDDVRRRLALEADVLAMAARMSAAGGDDDLVESCEASRAYDPVAALAEQYDTDLADEVGAADPGAFWARAAVVASGVPFVAALVLLLVRRVLGRRDEHTDPVDPGLVAQPWEGRGTTGDRVARTVAWALVTILPVPAAILALAAGQARAEADEQASRIYAGIAASGQLVSLHGSASELAGLTASLGDARQFVALDPDNDSLASVEVWVGQAEASRGEELIALVERVTRTPTVADGLDPDLIAALASNPDEWKRDLAEQYDLADEATELGRRRQLVDMALLVAALATTVIAVRPATGRRRLAVPVGMLALALLLAAGSLAGM
jgi:hypothetical protein